MQNRSLSVGEKKVKARSPLAFWEGLFGIMWTVRYLLKCNRKSAGCAHLLLAHCSVRKDNDKNSIERFAPRAIPSNM